MSKAEISDETFLRPLEVMRGRHPDLFSDTQRLQEHALPPAVFEHYLETLSTRSQEAQFEHFVRALAEKTICPNIRPQTGPMGGGDGKVDGETYPVAKQITDRWWLGDPEGEAQPWAFAFSVKKQWREKCRSDVEKIAGTGRPYGRVYCITSQPTKASTRADLEAEFIQKFEIPVTILDRTWIVQQIYDRDLLSLAVEKLNITGVTKDATKPGPRDIARQAELDVIDAQIADPKRYAGVKYQLVEDVLEAAVLARGLERSRAEIEGRLMQARRLASEVGDAFQMQRASYAYAWTAFWWFEDFSLFNELYSEVERHSTGSIETDHLELVFNLWQLLQSSGRYGHLSEDALDLEGRTVRLTEALGVVEANVGRPNNAHQAATLLALVEVTQAHLAGDAEQLDDVWRKLRRIVDESDPLGMYPIERLYNLAAEMGAHTDSEAFDRFFESLVDKMRQRRSDGEAGRAYSDRGFQKLEHGKPYDAIRFFGRAEGLLIKEEYEEELLVVLAGGSMAYERVGLLWAARNKMLVATHQALLPLLKQGKVNAPALFVVRRLIWLELQLGRVPHILASANLAAAVQRHLTFEDDKREQLDEEAVSQSAIFGLLLMRASLEQLRLLEKLPETLERSGWEMAKVALLHALGHDEAIRSEGFPPDGESADGMAEFFELWLKQPAGDDLPASPLLPLDGIYAFKTIILGCEISVELPEEPIAIGLAESFLGGLEALLATSTENDAFPLREQLRIRLVPGDSGMTLPSMVFAESHSEESTLTYPLGMEFKDAAQFKEFSTWLRDTLLFVMPRMVRFRDIEAWFRKVLGSEDAGNRAIALGNIVTVAENVFGSPPKVLLADWLLDTAERYELLRKTALDQPAKDSLSQRTGPPRVGQDDAPDFLADYESMKHSDRRIVTPIDLPLWDKAGWTGVAYLTGGPGFTPVAALVFKNQEAAAAIFDGLRRKYGSDDPPAIRIAIVKGLTKTDPHHYSWIIGPSLSDIPEDGKVVVFGSRLHRMQPPTSENLDRFLMAYRQEGGYLLLPATMRNPSERISASSPLLLAPAEDGIRMTRLEVRDAWQIGKNDPDASVLQNSDKPIVPDGVQNPPVLEALEFMKQLRARSPRPE